MSFLTGPDGEWGEAYAAWPFRDIVFPSPESTLRRLENDHTNAVLG